MTADQLDRYALPESLDTPAERRAAARNYAAALRAFASALWFVPASVRRHLRRAADTIEALANAL
ncbi:MAG: hypothetical protein IAE99_07945 [Rhodothermales bacterium]|nr:hypothetical protein [Rhodothermales bacterium]